MSKKNKINLISKGFNSGSLKERTSAVEEWEDFFSGKSSMPVEDPNKPIDIFDLIGNPNASNGNQNRDSVLDEIFNGTNDDEISEYQPFNLYDGTVKEEDDDTEEASGKTVLQDGNLFTVKYDEKLKFLHIKDSHKYYTSLSQNENLNDDYEPSKMLNTNIVDLLWNYVTYNIHPVAYIPVETFIEVFLTKNIEYRSGILFKMVQDERTETTYIAIILIDDDAYNEFSKFIREVMVSTDDKTKSSLFVNIVDTFNDNLNIGDFTNVKNEFKLSDEELETLAAIYGTSDKLINDVEDIIIDHKINDAIEALIYIGSMISGKEVKNVLNQVIDIYTQINDNHTDEEESEEDDSVNETAGESEANEETLVTIGPESETSETDEVNSSDDDDMDSIDIDASLSETTDEDNYVITPHRKK